MTTKKTTPKKPVAKKKPTHRANLVKIRDEQTKSAALERLTSLNAAFNDGEAFGLKCLRDKMKTAHSRGCVDGGLIVAAIWIIYYALTNWK